MPLHYIHLQPGTAPEARLTPPFRAVVVAEDTAPEDWRRLVADWLVEKGCLYVVAWGVDCENWHDDVDWAILETFNYGDIPDDRFVMTTWHADEPLSEAFWFAEHCAVHPDVALDETYIIHISGTSEMQQMLRSYTDSQIEGSGS